MRKVLASLPEIVIYGAFRDRFNPDGNDIRERRVVVEMGQEDANIKGMEEKWNSGSSLVVIISGCRGRWRIKVSSLTWLVAGL